MHTFSLLSRHIVCALTELVDPDLTGENLPLVDGDRQIGHIITSQAVL